MWFRNIRRKVKNKLFSLTKVEKLVREITCNDNSEPSKDLIKSLIQLSNEDTTTICLLSAVQKRLTDRKRFRHVKKSLDLVKTLFVYGNQKFADYFREKMSVLQVLQKFNYPKDKDVEKSIRSTSRYLIFLLKDPNQIYKLRKFLLIADKQQEESLYGAIEETDMQLAEVLPSHACTSTVSAEVSSTSITENEI
ncbi:hypothetical protein QYM36_018616 [Artemia franciscana]|uniref:ENTH domain-containing protein n=1 Tax=Artemia franciscana TaxID=6661 RepID=A0AA88HCH6_ARTSF|nr:hypothetical protein QYM36_018616 [Artemia franciscana]